MTTSAKKTGLTFTERESELIYFALSRLLDDFAWE